MDYHGLLVKQCKAMTSGIPAVNVSGAQCTESGVCKLKHRVRDAVSNLLWLGVRGSHDIQ